MRGLVFFILWISVLPVVAQQFAFELWHTGKAVLDTGDTLRGTIKYDLQTDILQLNDNKKLESFTPRKVLFFEIFDETVKRYRVFYSLPFAQTGQYKAPVFFELIEEGKLTVLCREALEYRTTSSPFFFYGSVTRLVLVNKFFMLKENGNIEEFRGKKNDWYTFMPTKADEVERYAKSNRLDLDEKYELSQVIAFYNSLFKKN